VWSKYRDEIDAIERTGELKAKLPGVKIPKTVNLTTDISEVRDKDLMILGIPTTFCRGVCEEAARYVQPETIVVNTAKGLESGTLKTMSKVTEESLPNNRVAILTGPSHAEELARGVPTTIVVASADREVSYYVQNTLSNSKFRIYVNDDILGCELGGSLKNVIALAAGVSDGLGLGDNTKAALMTRGIREISELGVAMGADLNTFGGLSGIGDLIVTCCSMHSRNRRAGILIGQGVSPEEAVERVGTVEGYVCTKNAHELAARLGVELPITEQLYSVLFEGKNPKDSIANLMDRPKKQETEKDFLGEKE
jgi:glycerol-3-phosphate dehydrogenase (NAD(P)+)